MARNILCALFLLLIMSLMSVFAGGGSPGGMGIEFTEVDINIQSDSIEINNGSTKLNRGFYDFSVKNHLSDVVEFEMQELTTLKVIRKFKINPGAFLNIKLKVTEKGVRFKANNIDKWYEYSVN